MNRKKEVLLAVLSESWAWVQLDGRVTGVDLPEWLHMPSVTLQIGYDMPLPIPDLVIDDRGVHCTLSFRRTPHTCHIPWKSIFAIADLDGKGALFPEDVPADLPTPGTVAQTPIGDLPAAPAEPEKAPDLLKSGKPRPSYLKLV